MRRSLIAAGLTFALTASGCNSFLTEQQATRDPNNPSTSTRNQLLTGIEAQVMDQQEGGVAMLVCQWMQQCAGSAGRFVELQGHYTSVTNSSFNGNFNSMYAGGGLISIRSAEASADADKDVVYKGVLEVLEALQVGWGTDIWGDIPYTDAAGANPTPKFDGQMAIYDALQTLLDKAIADLAGAGAGPGASDLFYGGDKTKWTQLANTLKARFYLHTVEKLGAGQYAKALAAAQKGISSSANSFHSVHTDASPERNIWAQFQLTSFGNDLVAGKTLVDLMKADNDPRLGEYFGKTSAGDYGGYDALTNSPALDQVSPISGSLRNSSSVLSFPQPLVTYEENQLIMAEANFMIGGAAAAQPFLTTVRTIAGKPAKPATIQSIMEEKYILLYQNVEFWNDYKRNCYPRMKAANAAYTAIPGRLLYGVTEQQTNPTQPQIMSEGSLQTFRNANDPAACPSS
ncbi:MAG: SusD/RagB family nutrient-binding outer membrane lipoprotein [bacterium]